MGQLLHRQLLWWLKWISHPSTHPSVTHFHTTGPDGFVNVFNHWYVILENQYWHTCDTKKITALSGGEGPQVEGSTFA